MAALALAAALSASLLVPGKAAAGQLRGVVLTPNIERPTPDGVTTGQSDSEVAAACTLGSTVARVMMNWGTLEPARGWIDPGYAARIDRMIGGLARCGIGTELTILGTPCWSTTAPSSGPGCPSSGWRYPPRAASDFGDIAAWSLQRWGPSLAAFEVWNEPNSGFFWRGSVEQYVALVGEAVDRARAIGTQVPILAGALAGSDPGYLSRMYAAGMRGQAGISMHPYTLCNARAAFVSPESPSCKRPKAPKKRGRRSLFRAGIASVHRAMLAAGDPGGIWLTEFGFPACPATPYCVPASAQARWLTQGLRLAASLPYVRAAIIFSLRDIGGSLDWNNRFGLLSHGFGPRPSYAAVRRAFRHGIHRGVGRRRPR